MNPACSDIFNSLLQAAPACEEEPSLLTVTTNKICLNFMKKKEEIRQPGAWKREYSHDFDLVGVTKHYRECWGVKKLYEMFWTKSNPIIVLVWANHLGTEVAYQAPEQPSGSGGGETIHQAAQIMLRQVV